MIHQVNFFRKDQLNDYISGIDEDFEQLVEFGVNVLSRGGQGFAEGM